MIKHSLVVILTRIDHFQVAPFVLFPSSLPRREYEKSVRLQPILNELTHKVAHDEQFLRETLAETIKVDEFTRKLFEIYDKTWKDEKTQVCPLWLALSLSMCFPIPPTSNCSFNSCVSYHHSNPFVCSLNRESISSPSLCIPSLSCLYDYTPFTDTDYSSRPISKLQMDTQGMLCNPPS